MKNVKFSFLSVSAILLNGKESGRGELTYKIPYSTDALQKADLHKKGL
jgi:hypothetical protein